MINERGKVYILREDDVATVDCVLMGLRTALNAIITARGVAPHTPTIRPSRPKEVNAFDQLVDEVMDERAEDMKNRPDLF